MLHLNSPVDDEQSSPHANQLFINYSLISTKFKI